MWTASVGVEWPSGVRRRKSPKSCSGSAGRSQRCYATIGTSSAGSDPIHPAPNPPGTESSGDPSHNATVRRCGWNIPGEHVKGKKGETRGHIVPLSDWAVRELEALQRLAKHSPWVIANDANDGPINPKLLTRGIARCQERMQKLGIEEFTLHDLRRTCRTGLSRLKIAPHIAERCLNHKQEKIAGTYDLYEYVDEKREALDKWAAHLEALRG